MEQVERQEMVEGIARRVVELIGDGRPVVGLIDAVEVARRLGISRTTVYEKADELGAVRIGSGPRARLRFDPALIEQRLAGTRPTPSAEPAGGRRARPPRRRRAKDAAGLLPIRGEAPR